MRFDGQTSGKAIFLFIWCFFVGDNLIRPLVSRGHMLAKLVISARNASRAARQSGAARD